MNSLFVTDSISRLNGGMTVAERGLQRELYRRLRVRVACLHDEFTFADMPAWRPVPVVSCPLRGPGSIGYSPELLSVMLRERADLAYFSGLWKYPSVAGLRWAARTRAPYLIAPHGMLDPWAVRNSAAKKRVAGALFQWKHLREAAAVRALCPSELVSIRAYGLKNPVCVVPNGVDLPELGSEPTPEPAQKILLYLGRLHPKKGLSNLLEAWAQVARESSGWQLAIAGWDQGGHLAELRARAQALGLVEDGSRGRLIFLGPQYDEDKETLLRAAAAVVLPSLSEGLPMAILEAWAYAKPVVMTPACNLPEGADSGWTVDPVTSSLVTGLRGLFSMSVVDRAQMGLRGRALVEDRFTWPVVGRQMHDVYTWILGGGSPPAGVHCL